MPVPEWIRKRMEMVDGSVRISRPAPPIEKGGDGDVYELEMIEGRGSEVLVDGRVVRVGTDVRVAQGADGQIEAVSGRKGITIYEAGQLVRQDLLKKLKLARARGSRGTRTRLRGTVKK